jgi:hypothetical protein
MALKEQLDQMRNGEEYFDQSEERKYLKNIRTKTKQFKEIPKNFYHLWKQD